MVVKQVVMFLLWTNRGGLGVGLGVGVGGWRGKAGDRKSCYLLTPKFGETWNKAQLNLALEACVHISMRATVIHCISLKHFSFPCGQCFRVGCGIHVNRVTIWCREWFGKLHDTIATCFFGMIPIFSHNAARNTDVWAFQSKYTHAWHDFEDQKQCLNTIHRYTHIHIPTKIWGKQNINVNIHTYIHTYIYIYI